MSKTYTFLTSKNAADFIAVYNGSVDSSDTANLLAVVDSLSVSANNVTVADEVYASNYTETAQVIAMDKAAQAARDKRDALLVASDWVAIKSLELGQAPPQAWLDYRQSLRDIPSQVEFPENVVWPTEPAE